MPFQTYQRHGILLSLFLLAKLVTSQQSPPEQTPPPPPPSYNFSPAMATAVIVLIIFFFSIGFISVYIRHFMHCLGIVVPGTNMRGGIEAWRRGGLSRGLDPTIIETFPTFLYSDVKIHRVDKSSLECAICLNEFTDHEILRMLPSCSHVFHPNCVDTWLTSHVTCPICRANLEINESDRSLSFNYLAHQDQPITSDNEELESQHNNQDVIVRLERSDEGSLVITSPTVSEINGVGDRTGKLPRSHSTGHSLVDDCERYTLRLPDEVRNKLVNVNLSGLPAAIVSPRVGYRARSVGCTNIEGVKQDHNWRFSVSPPFIARSNSVQSQKSDSVTEINNNNHSVGIMSSPISLLKSIKSPFNRVAKSDDIGERSTNRLWVNRTKQDVELEAQWNNNQ